VSIIRRLVILLFLLAAVGLELAAYAEWSVPLAVTGCVAGELGSFLGVSCSPR